MGLMGKQNKGNTLRVKPYRANGKIAPQHTRAILKIKKINGQPAITYLWCNYLFAWCKLVSRRYITGQPMDYEEIATETKRLDKPDWLKIITRLHNNFKGYPFDAESQEPLNAIGAVLKTLKPNKILDEQFKSRLSQLDCFSFRSYYIDTKTNQAIFWNPLETPFVKFKKNQTTEYQSANEYPAPDIIRMWIHLKTCSSSTD